METVLLKIPEVMERLAVGQTKVYELMSSGELRSVKVGRSRRVPSDELERFMAELDDSRPNLRLPDAEGVHSPRFVAPSSTGTAAAAAGGRAREVTLASVSIRARFVRLKSAEPGGGGSWCAEVAEDSSAVRTGRIGRIVNDSTSPRANSEEPGMLRSRVVLATFLVVTCAACSQDGASPAPSDSPSSDHVGALGADVFCSTRTRRLQRGGACGVRDRGDRVRRVHQAQRRVLRRRRDHCRGEALLPALRRRLVDRLGQPRRRSRTTTSPSPGLDEDGVDEAAVDRARGSQAATSSSSAGASTSPAAS